MDIVNLVVKVAAGEIDSARKGVSDLNKEMTEAESLGYKVGSAIGGGAKLALASIASLAGAVGGLTLAFAAQIDDLNDLADTYGYSITQISAMKTAAEAAGGSLTDVTNATTKVNKELSKGGEAFKTLGIALTDNEGKQKTAIDLATEVAEKYRDGGVSSEQFGAAQKILGSDVDKTSAILASQAGALEVVNELHEKGIGIYEESVKATDDFSDAKNRANLVMESAGSIIVAKVLPAFTFLIKALSDSYENSGLVKQAFDAFLGLIPGLISFGGTIGKIFITASNAVRAFGDTLGAVGAIVAALINGNFSGAMEIGKAWKGNVDVIDAQNKRAMASIDKTVSGMQAAVSSSNKLTLAAPTGGRNSVTNSGANTKGTPKKASAAKKAPNIGESSITSELLRQEQAMIKLRGEYNAFYGVQEQTLVQQTQATIASGKYAEQKNKEGQVIKAAATEQQLAALLSNAADADMLKNRLEIEKSNKKIEESTKRKIDGIRAEVASVAQSNAEHSISQRVLAQFGATQDDVNIAVGNYNISVAETALVIARASGATAAEIEVLQAKADALREIQGLDVARKDDTNEFEQSQNNFTTGWQNAFAQYSKDANDYSKIGGQAFNSTVGNMEGALDNFIRTGKINFGDLAKSIIADLAKIAIKKAIVGALGGGGSIFGAIIGGLFASGGAFNNGRESVVNKATAFGMKGGIGVMGEAGPEAIMPLTRGANGQLGVQAIGSTGSSGSQMVFNTTVNVQGGNTNEETGAIVATAARREMEQLARAVVRDEAKKQRLTA